MIYLGIFGTSASKAGYNQIIAEWLAAGRRRPTDPQAITIAEVVAAFRRHASVYYGPDSQTPTNIDEALRPVVRLYGKTPAVEFGPLRLKTVRESMIATGRVRSNINHQISRIRSAFKWAAENELIPASICHGLMAVKGLQAGRCGAVESEPEKKSPTQSRKQRPTIWQPALATVLDRRWEVVHQPLQHRRQRFRRCPLWSNSWKYQTPSTAASNAEFNLAANYAINFTAYEQAKTIDVANGGVTFNLNGNVYKSAGPVTISSTLAVDAGQLVSPEIDVDSGGTLAGNGQLPEAVDAFAGGALSPGDDVGSISIASLNLAPSSMLFEQLDGESIGSFGQVLTGTVDINGSALNLKLGYAPTLGANYDILVDNGTGPVNGTFVNLPQGGIAQAQFDGQTYAFRINYSGGDGNDVVLTNVVVPEPASTIALILCAISSLPFRRKRQNGARRPASIHT
ncbi:MAG: hypothetical protein ABSB42_06240 [Tepidisphaeraceae bacterium]|jgi:hypothetical protein